MVVPAGRHDTFLSAVHRQIIFNFESRPINAIVDRAVTLQSSTSPLPIQDLTALRQALQQVDVPTMLMVLVHYTRDEAFLAKFDGMFGLPWDPTSNRPRAELGSTRAPV